MADVTCPLTFEDWRTLLSHDTLPPTLRTILEDPDRRARPRVRVGLARSGSQVAAGPRGEPRHTGRDSTSAGIGRLRAAEERGWAVDRCAAGV